MLAPPADGSVHRAIFGLDYYHGSGQAPPAPPTAPSFATTASESLFDFAESEPYLYVATPALQPVPSSLEHCSRCVPCTLVPLHEYAWPRAEALAAARASPSQFSLNYGITLVIALFFLFLRDFKNGAARLPQPRLMATPHLGTSSFSPLFSGSFP